MRQRVQACVAAAAVAAAMCVVGGCAGRTPREPIGPSFSVLTFNVYYGLRRVADDDDDDDDDALLAAEGVTSAHSTIAAIHKADADIVCIQEADERWWTLVQDLIPNRYPNRLVRHDVLGGGFAVFSRWPLREVACLPPCDEEAWHQLLILEADTPVGRVQIVNVHLTPPIEMDGDFTLRAYFHTPAVRVREMARLLPRLDAELPTLVVGDFNDGDDSEPVAMLGDAGFTDAIREYRPTTNTWRHRLWGPFVLARRLDHVMYEPPLDALSVDLFEAVGSDHRAIKVVFERTDGTGDVRAPDAGPVYQPPEPPAPAPGRAAEEAGRP